MIEKVLNPASNVILVFFYVFCSTMLVLIIGVVAVLLFKLNALLVDYGARIESILAKTEALVTLANEKVTVIGGQTEAILAQGADTAGNVQDKVESTVSVVQKTVNAPLIGINALAAGVVQSIKVFGILQKSSVLNDTSTGERTEAVSVAVL